MSILRPKVINSKLCQLLLVETGTSVSSAATSYFRTIRRSSVPVGNALISSVPRMLDNRPSRPGFLCIRSSHELLNIGTKGDASVCSFQWWKLLVTETNK